MNETLQREVIHAIEENLRVMPVSFEYVVRNHDEKRAKAEFGLLQERRKRFKLLDSDHAGKYAPYALRYGTWSSVVAAFDEDDHPVALGRPLTIDDIRNGNWDDKIKSVLVEEVVEGSVVADLELLSEEPEEMTRFIVQVFQALGYETAETDSIGFDERSVVETDSDAENFSLVHGGRLVDSDFATEIDGYMDYTGALDDFWSFEIDWLKDRLEEIDPEEEYTVYHYKGKRWYVAPTAHQWEEYLVAFENEEKDDWEMEFLYWKPNAILEEALVSHLKAAKADCEVKGAINELLGLCEWKPTLNTDVEIELLDAYYDDRYEAARDLLDYIDWSMVGKEFDAWREVEGVIDAAWEKWLKDHGEEARKLLKQEMEAGVPIAA